MSTLYITDLDGTLLNKENEIPAEGLTIINELISNKMMFTYATARSFTSASIATKGLNLTVPVITYNGVMILDGETKNILYSCDFSEKEVENVAKMLKQKEIVILVYANIEGVERVSYLDKRTNEGLENYLNSRPNDKRFRPVSNIDSLFDGKPFYFTCIGEKNELIEIYEKFSNDERYRCTMQQEIYRQEYWCEIMPAKATKAEAIKWLKTLYKCDRLVTFGDAINDIPMFEISDECYAVDNATLELKKLATNVIGSNEENGVAMWLAKNYQLN